MNGDRTYGTLVLRGGYWLIQAEPQVVMRLKRVFSKLVKSQQDVLALSDTAENGRELSWFVQRYPMVMSAADQDVLKSREDQHRKFCNDVARIVTGDYTPREFALALPLRDYQKIGAEFILRTGGAIIGDDVGTGKTATAIGVIAQKHCRPALVVTLTHLVRQWKAELERFIPGIRCHILKTAKPYPLTSKAPLLERGGFGYDVLIANYHKLSGWSEELKGKVKCVVFDEAHELRHSDSQKYRAAAQIARHADVRAGLTATPIFNMGSEVRTVLEVLKPGALGSEAEFATEWCGTKGLVHDEKAFGSMLREQGLLLRRTRAEVGRELPALTIVPHVFETDSDEIFKLAGPAAELARFIVAQGGSPMQRMQASGELDWRLRQATGIAKAAFVADFVRLLVEQGERVLLYGWHRDVYAIWAERLADLKPVFFTGEESPVQKQTSKESFVSGGSKVLIMSLRAGAGIDGLQGVCRTVVFGELDWSPAVHEQATGRIHRDGQPDPVCAYFLMADSGSDPVIADVLGVKRSQLEGIRDPNSELVTKSQLDPDRIKKLAEDYLRQRGSGRQTEAA